MRGRLRLWAALGWQAARPLAAVLVLLTAFGCAAGLVRLLPWLVAPDVPAAISVGFARLLVAAALEAAVAVGVPLGVGLAVAGWRQDGSLRALAALGVRPAWIASVPLPVAAVLTASLLAGSSWLAAPARVSAREQARALLAAGDAACAAGEPLARLPGTQLVFWCGSQPPRLVGRARSGAGELWFSAATPQLDEAGVLRTGGLSMLLPGGQREPRVRVEVARRARLGGVPLLAAPSSDPGWRLRLGVWLGGLFAAAGAGGWLARTHGSAWIPIATACAAGVALLAATRPLAAAQWPELLLPLVTVAVLVFVGLLLQVGSRAVVARRSAP